MISWSTGRTVTEVGSWLALVVALGTAAYVIVNGTGRSALPPTTTRAVAARAPERPPGRRIATRGSARKLLVVRAARGDCWLEARLRSPTGDVLYRALLRHGRTVRFRAPVLWVEFGAGANVEVRVNGRLQRLPKRTVARIFHLRRE
jgi:hypothetical protein